MSNEPQKRPKTPPVTLEGVLRDLKGKQTPRIQTPLNDLPSKGEEMIQFCKDIGWELLEWQKHLAIHAHKVKPDGRWAHSEIGLLCARQQGKSTFMALRILTGMFLWDEKLQVGTAHKLTTSSEIFYKIFEIIDSVPHLQSEFQKKIESKGSQELKTLAGNRYLIRANNSSGRGIAAVDTIYMDEVREYKDEEVWASMRYSQMSAKNPQIWIFSSAGDQHSVILNKFKARAEAKIAGSDDTLAWFEWSAEPGTPIDPENPKFWQGIAQSNPSLGYTIHPDNIRSILNDEESIIRTEVLTEWVDTINPAISPVLFAECITKDAKLDPEKETWLAIDLSPDRKNAALVAAQKLDEEKFLVVLLRTWTNDKILDDKSLANDIADEAVKYHLLNIGYSARTAGAVAARLKPAGLPIEAIDGQEYATSCDEMLSAVSSGRLRHLGQPELTKQALSAVKLPFGDGGWIMGRKASAANISATVAMAMVSHYATRGDDGTDVVFA